jgi:hypothetical protein
MVEGPGEVYICQQCTRLAHDIFDHERPKAEERQADDPG